MQFATGTHCWLSQMQKILQKWKVHLGFCVKVCKKEKHNEIQIKKIAKSICELRKCFPPSIVCLKRYYCLVCLVCSISFYYHNFVYIVKKAFSCCCRQRKNTQQTVLSCENAKAKTRKNKKKQKKQEKRKTNTKYYGKFCCATLMCVGLCERLRVAKWVHIYASVCLSALQDCGGSHFRISGLYVGCKLH